MCPAWITVLAGGLFTGVSCAKQTKDEQRTRDRSVFIMEAADYNSSAPSTLEAKRSTGEISARLPSSIFWSNNRS
jgi:hypothetical protein